MHILRQVIGQKGKCLVNRLCCDDLVVVKDKGQGGRQVGDVIDEHRRNKGEVKRKHNFLGNIPG